MWTFIMLVTSANLGKVIELSLGWVSTRKVKWKPFLYCVFKSQFQYPSGNAPFVLLCY